MRSGLRVPPRPTVYEINTATWLERLGRAEGRRLTLGEVPAAEWDAVAALPVDAVWLMGVWQRSPTGLEIALQNPEIVAGNRAALSDLRADDVIGSPYCVRDYVVDERFGGTDGLAAARDGLARRELALILDYVPNHVAPDHPWLIERPDCFIHGAPEDLAQHPDAYMRVDGEIVANGRDPYFPPWPDVVQLNAFAPALRDAVGELLVTVGAQCDGLRCDMAMLMTNEVFARTWGDRAGAPAAEEFWPTVIARAKSAHPDLLFIAEAYWDMEWTLQQHGFDFTYDKRLYDRLVHDPPEAVRGHLQADAGYQEHLIRFIENHDEPRAAATFAAPRARAAAVVMSTLEGARLYHDGQLDGFRTHVPVFLGRAPDESTDESLHSFYERLIRAVADSDLRGGAWQLCDCTGWPDNDSYRSLVSWCWSGAAGRHLVVVNLSAASAQARVQLPWTDLPAQTWQLSDALSAETFERAGDELGAEGLYVALEPWGSYLLGFR